MPLQYSCFISYRHTQDDITQRLGSHLKREISRMLDMEVYVDQERLQGGDFFNNKLARALCESVCLVVVYTPTYFSQRHTYCAREYKAMELLEEKRLRALRRSGLPKNHGHGLIIPIVYRGKKELPESIKSNRQCHVFEDYQISGTDNLENPEYLKEITEIAEYIKARHHELRKVEKDICKFCDVMGFPTEADISDWLESMLTPKLTFPGRRK